MTSAQWQHATIIFLGDYVDRGADPRGVIEFLSTLRARAPPTQHIHFLCGNHDLAFALFVGALPDCFPVDAPLDLSASQANMLRDERRLLPSYTGSGRDTMHLQGLRWGLNVYQSASTFTSYGAALGDRDALLANMPPHHLAFLRALPWVVDVRVPRLGRVLAVHAGFVADRPLDAQLAALRARDVRTESRWSWLSGRDEVIDTVPAELLAVDECAGVEAAERVWIVSGHHHALVLSAAASRVARVVCDLVGGSDDSLAAVVLPDRHLVCAPSEPVQCSNCI